MLFLFVSILILVDVGLKQVSFQAFINISKTTYFYLVKMWLGHVLHRKREMYVDHKYVGLYCLTCQKWLEKLGW